MTLHLLDDKTAPKSQRFRWQLKAKNGKIVGASTEGFSTIQGCATNASKVETGILKAMDFRAGEAVRFAGREPVKVRP